MPDCFISYWSRITPDKEAIAGLLTYRELDQLITRTDPTPIFVAHRTVETIALFFALWRRDRVACPLSPRLPPQALADAIKQLDPNQPFATLLFTSGTSNRPKIAAHSRDNHLQSALGAIPLLNLSENSRYLLNLPLNHVGGLAILWRTFVAGATLVLSPDLQPTHASLVPTQLYRSLDAPYLRSLQCLLIGGAPMTKRIEGLPLFQSYGMTETSSMIVFQKKLINGAELKIAQNGEILVRGPMLFQGYFDQRTGVNLPLTEDGWFATRDLGRLHPDGKLEILGRLDRQFISGGENIQPEEIEAALLSLPGISMARVQPKADPEFGHLPIAYLTTTLSPSEIDTRLREKLPGYKIPREYHLTETPIAAKDGF